jgi:hypothetical protein
MERAGLHRSVAPYAPTSAGRTDCSPEARPSTNPQRPTADRGIPRRHRHPS